MKIGIIHLGRRGAGVAIAHELAQALAQKADVFAVVSSQADNIGLWRRSGLPLLETETFDGWISACISLLNFPRLKGLAGQIIAQKADILLFPMFHLWMPFLQNHLGKIPSIVFVHDPVPHPGLFPAVIRSFEDLSFRQAARCVIFSEIFKNGLQLRGVPMDKVDVIPLGELSYYQKISASAGEKKGKKILLFFGRITEYKGLGVLLEAFQPYAGRDDLELLIAGEGDLSAYSGLIRGLPNVRLENRFIPEAEVGNLFENATIVILPYTSASQSGVIPIAAAFKLPVIATRVGGIPEQVVDGVSGLLIEPGSVAQLSAAIGRLLVERDLAVCLGNALYEEHVLNRNWSKTAGRVLEICAGVV